MPSFSVIFCGTPEFAVPSLRALASDAAFNVIAVVTQPDKPVGRSGTITPPPVKRAAEELGIPVLQPQRLNAGVLEPYPCDFLVVVAYGQILRDDTLSFPAIAPVNVHASLLPRWRGAAPIQAALLAGDTVTGVTIQMMVKELDAGPVLSQRETPIDRDETASSLHDRLSAMGAELLTATLRQPLHPIEQPQNGITMCTKLTRENGIADHATLDAVTIERMVRAFNPWPGVTVTIDRIPLKILRAGLNETPGAVALPCANGTTLWLTEVQAPGKKPMSANAWARGRHKR